MQLQLLEGKKICNKHFHTSESHLILHWLWNVNEIYMLITMFISQTYALISVRISLLRDSLTTF